MYIVLLVFIILIFGVVSIGIMGVLYYKGIPSDINSIIGYRTKASTASKETWKEASKLYR